jgi:hypothetical protein
MGAHDGQPAPTTCDRGCRADGPAYRADWVVFRAGGPSTADVGMIVRASHSSNEVLGLTHLLTGRLEHLPKLQLTWRDRRRSQRGPPVRSAGLRKWPFVRSSNAETGPPRTGEQRNRGYTSVICQTYWCKLVLPKSKPRSAYDQPWWPQCAESFAKNDIDMAGFPRLDRSTSQRSWPLLGYAMRDLGNPLVVAAAPSAPAATEPTRMRGPRWGRRY